MLAWKLFSVASPALWYNVWRKVSGKVVIFLCLCYVARGGGGKPDWWKSIHTNQPEAGLVFGLCPCQSAVLGFITCCITLSLTCASRALATSKCTLFCAHQQGSCQCAIRKWKKSIENKDNSLRHILFGSLCFTWHNAFFEGAGGVQQCCR